MQKRILLLGFMFISQLLSAQSPKWVNYANVGSVFDVLPTNEYVWISTQGGLERIDRATGARKIFQPSNSGLRGLGVSAVHPAANGDLWVSGNYGGLFRFDGEDDWEQFYTLNTGEALTNVEDLEITPEGNLWFIGNIEGSNAGQNLYQYDGVQFTEHMGVISPVLGNNWISFIALDTSGVVFASYGGKKIVRYDGVVASLLPTQMLLNEAVADMVFDKHNTLWVSTFQFISANNTYVYRIRHFDGNTWTLLDESTLGGDISPVNRMFNDEAGNFYVVFNLGNGENTAFAKFDGNTWEYTKVSDLPNVPLGQSLNLVTVDDQGVLWFLSFDGSARKVYEFDGQTWKAYETEIYPLAGNFIFDVAFDCDNNTWFGGRDVLTKFDGLSWENFTFQDIGLSGPHFEIWSLAVDTNTCDLWISFSNASTASVSFVKYDGNTFTQYSTPGGWEVYETAIAKDGTLWVASGRSGLGKFDGNGWTWFNEQNSPVSDDVHNVTLDYEQNVWINTGFPSAVMRWDGSTWLKFDFNNSPIIYSDWLFVDHESKIWTNGGNSLLRFNGVQWQEYPVPSTGFDDVYSMVQDQEHNYWLSNSQGVHKFDGSTFESYNFIDYPLSDNEVSRVRVDPFGNKWFMHKEGSGVTVYNENGISNQVISLLAAVRGKVFFDANQNGQHEQGTAEPGIPNEKVLLLPNTTTVFTNFDGNYTLYPAAGNYELNYSGSNIYTPTTAQNLPLIAGTNEQSGLNFGAWAENAPDSISLDMSVGSMRCDYETNVWLSVRNYGLLEATGEVTLLYDTALTFLHADPLPDVIQDSLLTWHFSGLSLFELQQIKVVFQVPGANALGQIISLRSGATVIEGGIEMASDEEDEWAEVHCSYDPNDKASASIGPSVAEYSLLNDALDFTIRFQNSGNDTAFTVILRDTLDTNLDFSSLQIVSSSHPMRTILTSEGVLSFVFDNIDLLWESIDYAGSQGFVKYRIAPKGNLQDPTAVRNTAHIYFDFNPAIVTNTTLNVLVETLPFTGATEIAENNVTARVYPNPNSGNFWVEWLEETPAQTWQISIVDMLGRSCFQSSYEQKTIEIQGLSSGFYFVFLEKEGKVDCFKLVVQR